VVKKAAGAQKNLAANRTEAGLREPALIAGNLI
jgi:hypothetical protein